jgi:Protein of unknown function (DUF2889)
MIKIGSPAIFPWARESAGPAPLRRPGSVRRTTSIDVHWPSGFGEASIFDGTARDIFTPHDGGIPILVGEGQYRIKASPMREILEIAAFPDHANTQEIVGIRGGGASRIALGRIMGTIRGTPLYQIMDDFAGASLVSGWVLSVWSDDWVKQMRESSSEQMRHKMTNICTGFAEGATSLTADGGPDSSGQSKTEVGELVNPNDPQGWHDLPHQEGPRFRRARRIDVWLEEGLIHCDVGFQDSGPSPQGPRMAVHEYQVAVSVDPANMTVKSLKATPRILPYRECPGAVANIHKLIGHRVASFRQDVLETLPGILGCTHLNDVLRALADVPILADHLRQ